MLKIMAFLCLFVLACDATHRVDYKKYSLLLMVDNNSCKQEYAETGFGPILIPEFRCNNGNLEFCNDKNLWEVSVEGGCE